MDTITLIALVAVCAFALVLFVFFKTNKAQPRNRPNIDIDFDMAKDREDKNRYYS